MQMDDALLAARVGAIRREMFGDDVEALARVMGIPARTWENYERGVTIPGRVLLHFLVYAGLEPHWLLTGEGEPHRIYPPGEGLRDS